MCSQSHPLPHHILHRPDTLHPPHAHLRRLLPRYSLDNADRVHSQDLLLAWRPLRYPVAHTSFHHDLHAGGVTEGGAGQPAYVERGGAFCESR